MIVNIQDKKINIESWEDFENIMEKLFYAYKINQWLEDVKNWKVFTENEVFSKYNLSV